MEFLRRRREFINLLASAAGRVAGGNGTTLTGMVTTGMVTETTAL